MRTIEYLQKPQGAILEAFYLDRSRVSFIMGPLGSGKTIQSCQKLFTLICEQEPNAQEVRPSRWFAVRNTYSDLETTTIKDWLGLYEDLGAFTWGHPPEHVLDFMLEDGTNVQAEIIFLAMDRPAHVKKLRGSQGTGFWLNEVKELPRAVVDMADLRHGRYPSGATGGVEPTWHGMIGDTNAPDEDHWYYEMAEEIKPKGWKFFRQPGGLIKSDGKWVQNPMAENLHNLPKGYYINGKEGKKEDWILVNLANEYGFVVDGKPIYPEYVDSLHVQEVDAIPGRKILVGIDFGLTPAAVFMQEDVMGRWRWFDELISTRMGAKQFGEELHHKCQRDYPGYEFEFWGDPAGSGAAQTDETTPFQMLRVSGIDARPAHTNDPEIRREAVAEPLTRLIDGVPGLVISPRCKITRKGMAGAYCYRRIQVAGEDRFHDKPDKNQYSHPCEAGQYGMLGGGAGRKVMKSKNHSKPVVMKSNWSPL